MNTHPSPASSGRVARRLRFTTTLLSAALALTAAMVPLRADTLYGLAEDRQVSGTGSVTDSNPMLSGYSGSNGLNPVFVFPLPTLPAGHEFSSASLRVYQQGKDGTPSFNADLYGLGVSPSPSVYPDDFYFGPSDSSALLIKDNLLTPSNNSGPAYASTTELSYYLNAAYNNGSGAGQYVFFRVSPDVAGLNYNYTRYRFYSRDYSGGSYYWTSISYETADAQSGWESLPLGGGGYVTGLVSNSSGDAIYGRTDVGGAFRWVPLSGDPDGNGSWVSISDAIVPFGTANSAKLMGVESIATDVNHPDRVYMGAGNKIFVSDNQGGSWTEINPSLTMGPNQGGTRFYGERLSVDPNNPDVVWYGSIQDGLQKGVNAGGTWTWTQIPSSSVPFGAVSSGSEKAGVTITLCDANGGSTIVYAGVYDSVGSTGGVYVSTNNGASWAKIPLASGSLNPRRVVLAANGTLYVTGGTSGVFKLPRNGSLSRLASLPSGPFFNGVAVDPNDSTGNTVYVADRASRKLWRSANGGTSWSVQDSISDPRTEPDGTPSLTGYWFGNTSSLLINPADSNELWAADFFGVARTRNAQDLGNAGSAWNTLQNNQEETVVLALRTPPSGPVVFTGLADVKGFRYNSILWRPYDTNGSSFFGNPYDMNNVTGLDFSESDPNVWARVGMGTNYGANNGSNFGTGAYSIDGGDNWLAFGEIDRKTIAGGSPDWTEWDLTTYLANQKALGVQTVTLVLSSARGVNTNGANITFASKEDANASLHPALVLNGSTSVSPDDDTMVSGAATSSNYGSSPSFSLSFAYGNASSERQGYLRFDLSSVSTITSAVLRLYRTAPTSAGREFPVGVYACTNTSWTEGAITWSNRPRPYASSPGQPNQRGAYRTGTNIDLSGGRIAVSATDPDRLVWMPVGTNNRSYYSVDRGVTWTLSTGGPKSEIRGIYTNGNSTGISCQPLAADRANGMFYSANFGGDAHQIYSSPDGATWTLASTVTNGNTYNMRTPQLVAAPVSPTCPSGGDVWLCDDSDYNGNNGGGLWRSTDSASTWSKISGVGKTTAVAFGKSANGVGYTVFVAGSVGGVKGVFRSDDYGSTWTQLADPTVAEITALAGDRQEYGRVYFGTAGRGVFQGKN